MLHPLSAGHPRDALPGCAQPGRFPVWLALPLLVGGPPADAAVASVRMGVVLLLALTSWAAGWGRSGSRSEARFAAGWMVAWIAILTTFLHCDALALPVSGAVLVGGLLLGAAGLQFALSRRRRLAAVPAVAGRRDWSTSLVLGGLFVLTASVLAALDGARPAPGDLVLGVVVAALALALAPRGRVERGEGMR